jgi:hypothetical protein
MRATTLATLALGLGASFGRAAATFDAAADILRMNVPSPAKGKGKGKRARSAIKVRRHAGSHYPFSSHRQDAQAARTQRMVVVNGRELMQTIPARLRAAPLIARNA